MLLIAHSSVHDCSAGQRRASELTFDLHITIEPGPDRRRSNNVGIWKGHARSRVDVGLLCVDGNAVEVDWPRGEGAIKDALES